MILRIVIPLCLLAILSCIEPQVVQNYPDYQPQHRIAIIRKTRFSVAVSESQRWGDTLQLTPGRYLLEYREKYTGIKGAAICRVEAGGIYEIEIVRKRYMEMSGRYVYEGKCKRLNEPSAPTQYEFPEDRDESETENPVSDSENRDSRDDSEVRPLKPSEEDTTSDDPVLNPYEDPRDDPADAPQSEESEKPPTDSRSPQSQDKAPETHQNKADPDEESEYQARAQ